MSNSSQDHVIGKEVKGRVTSTVKQDKVANRASSVLLSLVSILLVVGLLVGLAEVAVRVLNSGGMDYTLEMWKYARELKRVAADPKLGHEHIPGRTAHLMGVDVSINSHGLRDREIPYETPANTKRIIMLGDSVTFGWGVPFDKTASKQLESLINGSSRPERFEVIDTGVGNYNSQMEVEYFFNEGVKYSPDIIVLNYFINDAEDTPRYAGNFINEHFQSWVYLSARIDILKRLVSLGKSWDVYYDELYRDDASGWQGAKAAIGRLGDYCRSANKYCVLANYPDVHRLKNYPFKQINKKLEGVAAASGLDYLDLLPSLDNVADEALWVTLPDPHPNATAHTYFAKAIYDRLQPRLN